MTGPSSQKERVIQHGSGTVADPHGAPWGYSSTGEHRRCIPKAGGSNPPISTDVTAAVSHLLPPFNSSRPVAGPHGAPSLVAQRMSIGLRIRGCRFDSCRGNSPCCWLAAGKRWQVVLWSLSGNLSPRNMGVRHLVVRPDCKSGAWRHGRFDPCHTLWGYTDSPARGSISVWLHQRGSGSLGLPVTS